MEFIYYPKCTTCIKAKKYLDSLNIEYSIRNIKEENPTYEELKKWYQNNNIELRKLFNTSGILYKEKNLKSKLPTMTDEEKLKLLSTNGMLIKRPVLVDNNKIILGFKENIYEKLKKVQNEIE